MLEAANPGGPLNSPVGAYTSIISLGVYTPCMPSIKAQHARTVLKALDESFALETKEIATLIGMEPGKALAFLNEYQNVLWVGTDVNQNGMGRSRGRGVDGKYVSLVWQLWEEGQIPVAAFEENFLEKFEVAA